MLKITALYASLAALIYLFLCYQIVTHRRSKRLEIGDGGDAELLRRIRGQANAAEYMPLVLILLAVAEANGAPIWLLHGFGLIFTVARIIHPLGFVRTAGVSFGRFWGTLLTWLTLLGLSIYNILNFTGLV